MLDCKPDEKGADVEADLTSMSSVLKIILAAFKIGGKPSLSLPLPIGAAAAYLKPGMSPRNIAARQMAAAESIGLPMGNVFADGPNKDAQAMLSNAKELHNEIQNNMSISAYGLPGASQHVGSGSAGPIPVVITSTNPIPYEIKGSAN